MKIGQLIVAFGAGCALTLLTASALSPQNDGGMPSEEEMQKMFEEAMMKYGAPGAEHAELAQAAGSWDCKVKHWYVPGTPAETMSATSESEMIMDGRYLLEHFSADWEGMPFKGVSLTGYDRMNKKYQSLWIDNMSTAIMMSEGKMKGDMCELTGMMPDMMTGQNIPTRSTIEHVNTDKHIMKMYRPGPDGNEFMMMEITYTRANVDGHDHDHDHGSHEGHRH